MGEVYWIFAKNTWRRNWSKVRSLVFNFHLRTICCSCFGKCSHTESDLPCTHVPWPLQSLMHRLFRTSTGSTGMLPDDGRNFVRLRNISVLHSSWSESKAPRIHDKEPVRYRKRIHRNTCDCH